MAAPGFEYFDSTMVGAPVLTGQVGKMALLMDWFLVGKGGWDIAFTGTNLRAYRSQTGNRMYLRLDDAPSLYSRLRAYRSMTAISTGTFQFPNNTQALPSINTWGVRKGYANTASPIRYWGVRTNRWFVLFVESTVVSDASVNYRNFCAFGDFPSLCEADSHNTGLIGTPDCAVNYYQTLNEQCFDSIRPAVSYPAQAWAAMSGTPNGAISSPLCGLHAPFKGSSPSHIPGLLQGDRLNIGALVLGSTNSTTVGTNGILPRGNFPNVSMLYGPASDVVDPQLPCVDLVPFSIGSRTFLPLMPYSNGAGGYVVDTYLLEITDTDGAL